MKLVGSKTAELISDIDNFIKPFISTNEINSYCKEFIEKKGMESGCLNYHGFPKEVCISVNDEVCHGISSEKIITNPAIVSVDCVLQHTANGRKYFGDSCFSFVVGELSLRRKLLVSACYETMWKTIMHVKDGVKIGELCKIMEKGAKENGFDVVRDFTGHAIGLELHEHPSIPFYYINNDPTMHITLKSGQYITIEPMFVEGSHRIKILRDGWTAITRDGGWSSQFEHTLFITENGCEVLTFNKMDEKNGKPRVVKI